MLVRLANICNEFDKIGLHDVSAKLTSVMIKLSEKDEHEQDEMKVEDIASELESAVNSIEKILNKMKRKKDTVKYSENVIESCDKMLNLFKTSAKNDNKPLNKPFRTPGGPKKFSVYVKNEQGNVIKVNFGDPNMRIKDNIPGRRKNFRARHNCDNPGPKTKARYWSCRQWSDSKSDI